jgi:serine/threonine protein kinase
MAPEVMKNGVYTKSVDIWSIGIILHLVLTGGKHPLYNNKNKSLSYEEIKQNILQCKKVVADKNLSKLAANLFEHLTAIQPSQRY